MLLFEHLLGFEASCLLVLLFFLKLLLVVLEHVHVAQIGQKLRNQGLLVIFVVFRDVSKRVCGVLEELVYLLLIL